VRHIEQFEQRTITELTEVLSLSFQRDRGQSYDKALRGELLYRLHHTGRYQEDHKAQVDLPAFQAHNEAGIAKWRLSAEDLGFYA
jgi:hypothetical protein